MFILSTISRIVSDFSAARARYRTERAIGSLPAEVQKDIGWPPVRDVRVRDHGAGTWAGAK